MTDETDAALWRRIAADDDQAAFAVVFDRHVTAIHRYCLRRTGSTTAAEDATSLVFLHAWRRRRQVPLDRVGLLPWLYGVAGHTVRNLTRATRRQHDLLRRIYRPEVSIDVTDALVDRVDADRQATRIATAVARLPAGHREAFSLVVFADLTYSETATVLDVPIRTVRSRVSRAKELLRQELGSSTTPSTAATAGTDR